MKLTIVLGVIISCLIVNVLSAPPPNATARADCEPTLTTVSGRHAPGGQLCKNQVIFEDNFDSFNLDIWEHENNMNGGGVSYNFFFLFFNKFKQKINGSGQI